MEYLCFVNGRDKNELVKIFEGEFYEIDRVTTNCKDSDAIRTKFKKPFAEFQTKYPHAKNGAVRIYGDSVYSENDGRVLYQKHRVAFNHIINDTHFLRWSSRIDLDSERKDRLVWDTYILKGIVDYRKEKTRINQFITRLKRDDRAETGLNGGGRRYYLFVRALLNRYEDYRKQFHKPSIEDIWQEHLEQLKLSKISLQKEQIGTEIIRDEDEELMLMEVEESRQPNMSREIDTHIDDDIDPDRIYYEEQPVYNEPLYDFFLGDSFDRYYSAIFKDDSLMVISDLSHTEDESKTKALNEVVHTCYSGQIYMVSLSNFKPSDSEKLNDCHIVIVYSEIDSKRLQLVIATAVQNKANVVLISNDSSILEQYSKKIKSIIPILDSEEKHIAMKKQLRDFFIEQYNLAKGYNK